jgi:serine/threonine-protein kinase
LDPQEFTVKQATAADLIGTRVGHAYVLTGVLGTGGMGNVFRASQETIGRDVAIKFLPLEIATDATAVQRLGREAKALGQLNHPGIVTTFDFGFTEKREPYLVLELVEGKSLQTILDQEKGLEMARALQIFVQICEAMSYAHSQGIIHRDLKPLNIMIGIREQFEFAKILDFGIVKLTSEVQQLTKSGEIWGSPFYMSPEQCTGGTVDNRSDIYSLGVVMFRSLTGEVPHRGASFPETIARKLSEYPPSFESIAP